MGYADIVFPNLNIWLLNVPKNIVIGNFTIAWYGVMIALGMLAGLEIASYVGGKYSGLKEEVSDFFLWGIVFGVLGARIYYVVFEWDYYRLHLSEIFNIRNGGLAIYGGVIASFLAVWVFTKKRKISFPELMDTCIPGLALGQAIGRWGNFFNREVFGGYSDGLFAMQLPTLAVRGRDISDELTEHIAVAESGVAYIQVHPTFLYESLWNLALVIIILCVWKKGRRFRGENVLIYLGGYGLGRFWIEGIRTDRLYIGETGIAVSQLLAGICVVASIILWLLAERKRKRDGITGRIVEVVDKNKKEDDSKKAEETESEDGVPAEQTAESATEESSETE